MSLSNDLYQQVILDHNKKPRNFHKLAEATHVAEGFNPLCGDHLFVYLRIDAAGCVQEAAFEGSGCAISKASASMMTTALVGKSVAETRSLFTSVIDRLKGDLKPETDPERAAALGKLKIFAGIWQYPSRVKCAALGWHAMNGALDQQQSVSTE